MYTTSYIWINLTKLYVYKTLIPLKLGKPYNAYWLLKKKESDELAYPP